jgi:hypothetical protein
MNHNEVIRYLKAARRASHVTLRRLGLCAVSRTALNHPATAFCAARSAGRSAYKRYLASPTPLKRARFRAHNLGTKLFANARNSAHAVEWQSIAPIEEFLRFVFSGL